MSGWPMVKLGEICTINPRRDKSVDYRTEISFIEMKSLLENGSVYPTITHAEKYLKGYTPFKHRDILVAKITPCFQNGKIGIANLATEFGFGTTEFHILRTKEDLLPEYLTAFLRQRHVLLAGEKQMTGSGGQRRVPRAFLEQLNIPLPPLGEQKRIAEILSKINYGISKAESEIENLDKLQKSTISNFIISCKTTALEKLATLSGGLSLGSHRKDKPLRVDYLRVANVFWGKISYKDLKTLNCTEKELKRTLLKNGDILITEAHANRLQVGRSAIIKDLKQALTFQNHLFRARPNNGINSEILAATLGSTSVRRQLYQMAKTTSGLNTISISQVRSLQIPILDDDKQQGLLEIIQEINKAQHALHQKLALLQELQRSISVCAFAGEL